MPASSRLCVTITTVVPNLSDNILRRSTPPFRSWCQGFRWAHLLILKLGRLSGLLQLPPSAVLLHSDLLVFALLCLLFLEFRAISVPWDGSQRRRVSLRRLLETRHFLEQTFC